MLRWIISLTWILSVGCSQQGMEVVPAGATPAGPNNDLNVTACATSADGTAVTSVGPTLCDASANVWAIAGSGKILLNGHEMPNTGNVIELTYVSGIVWQQNTRDLAGNWIMGGYTPITPQSQNHH